jgi:hypothetical protein
MKIKNDTKHANFERIGDIMEIRVARNFDITYKDKANLHNKEAMKNMFRTLKKKGIQIPSREELDEKGIDQVESYVTENVYDKEE